MKCSGDQQPPGSILYNNMVTYAFICYFSKLEHIAHNKAKNQNTVKTNAHAHTHTHTHTQLIGQLKEDRFQRWFESCEYIKWPNFLWKRNSRAHFLCISPELFPGHFCSDSNYKLAYIYNFPDSWIALNSGIGEFSSFVGDKSIKKAFFLSLSLTHIHTHAHTHSCLSLTHTHVSPPPPNTHTQYNSIQHSWTHSAGVKMWKYSCIKTICEKSTSTPRGN